MSFGPHKPSGAHTSRAASRPASAARTLPSLTRPAPSAPASSPSASVHSQAPRGAARSTSFTRAVAASSSAFSSAVPARSPSTSRLLQRAAPLTLRQRRPPTFSFSRVAKDVLVLCMQFCSSNSLLRLSRCSRFTLEAASSAAAWRGASLKLHVLSLPVPNLPELLPRSLLRFCDLGVHWAQRSGNYGLTDEIMQICAVPRLRSLRDFECMSPQWLILIRHPSLSQLTDLRVSWCSDLAFNSECLAAAVQAMPQLRTLALSSWAGFPPNSFARLKDCQSLTQLRLYSPASDQHIEDIARCTSLTRLSLTQPPWDRVLADPALRRQIAHLTLHNFQLAGGSECGLWSFGALHTLRLQSCVRVKEILTQLADPQKLPTLKHLGIGVTAAQCAQARVHDSVPRRLHLLPLLQARPDVHLTLWFPSLRMAMNNWSIAASEPESSAPRFMRQSHACISAEYEAIRDAMGDRVCIRPNAISTQA